MFPADLNPQVDRLKPSDKFFMGFEGRFPKKNPAAVRVLPEVGFQGEGLAQVIPLDARQGRIEGLPSQGEVLQQGGVPVPEAGVEGPIQLLEGRGDEREFRPGPGPEVPGKVIAEQAGYVHDFLHHLTEGFGLIGGSKREPGPAFGVPFQESSDLLGRGAKQPIATKLGEGPAPFGSGVPVGVPID